ncbi:MAG: sugar nucleotide-binding protein [Lachnospiraceae bacterium]|nr:sugar nucleotide-binding protein [Lachnospiraceae bacterium]
MKRLLVTGASGFLGSRIVKFYSGKYDVLAPGHSEMDITDEENVYKVFKNFKPHFVIHSAAVSDVGMCDREPERSWKINVDGSRNIAAASAEFHAKCLLCSSDQVYFGSNVKGLHREDEIVSPANTYGREKKKAEEECLDKNPECVLLRLSWMYDTRTMSEWEHSDFFRTLLSRLQAQEDLCYPVYDVRGITDVNEVLFNFEKTLELKGGVYNFGSPNDKNTYETVRAMFMGLKWDAARLKRNEEAFASNPRNISMSPAKLNQCGITFLPTLEALIRNGSRIDTDMK